MMRKIECSNGLTQIGRVLAHALKETDAQRVRGLVYVGDAFEEALGDLKHDGAAVGKSLAGRRGQSRRSSFSLWGCSFSL
jgi:hypothetical protein